MRLSIFTIYCLMISNTSCMQKDSPTSDPAPRVLVPNEPSSSYPTREEVSEYLEGKSIPLTGVNKPNERDPKLYTLKKGDIEALEVEQSASQINDSPWRTTINFITKTDDGRYAIKGRLSYRRVEKKCAFYGFEIEEVAKQ
jgi:hypothetical protein